MKSVCSLCTQADAQFQDLQTQKSFCFQCFFGKFQQQQLVNQNTSSDVQKTESSSTYFNYGNPTNHQHSQNGQGLQEFSYEKQRSRSSDQDLYVGNLKSPSTPPKGYQAFQGQNNQKIEPYNNNQNNDLMNMMEVKDEYINLNEQPDIFKEIDDLLVGNGSKDMYKDTLGLQGNNQMFNYYGNGQHMCFTEEEMSLENTFSRKERVQRYLEKKRCRRFKKIIRYESRKKHAQIRPRIKGRFARRDEVEKLKRMIELGQIKLQKPMKYFLPQQSWNRTYKRNAVVPQTEEQWNDIFNNLCEADWENVLSY